MFSFVPFIVAYKSISVQWFFSSFACIFQYLNMLIDGLLDV